MSKKSELHVKLAKLLVERNRQAAMKSAELAVVVLTEMRKAVPYSPIHIGHMWNELLGKRPAPSKIVRIIKP